MSEISEENYFKSKSNNNFCKQYNSQVPEGLNNYKHCLPSFLIDDYFQTNSDYDNNTSDEKDKDDIKKSNSFNNTKEDKNISKYFLEEEDDNKEKEKEKEKEKNIINENNKIDINIGQESKTTDDTINTNNISLKTNDNYNNEFNKSTPKNNNRNMNIDLNTNNTNNNLNNNIPHNLYDDSYSINLNHNFFANSFNTRNNSGHYYQNYLNSLNNNIQNIANNKEPNYNILNNNINIINNNNFMDGKNIPFYNNTNYIPSFSFNSQTQNQKLFSNSNQSTNNINDYNTYMNNSIFSANDLNFNKNKIFSFNNISNTGGSTPPMSALSAQNFWNEKKLKKKHKKELIQEENFNIIKKLLNLSNYSLYNYLITQKGSRDAQTVLSNMKEKEVDILLSKLKNYISDITLDKYGNYFTLKLIQICVPSQRLKLIQSLKERFIEISNNTFGTHPLQCLMEIIIMPEEKKLILKYILGNESILAFDSKGTHILQKYISNTNDEIRYELNLNLVNLIDKLIVDNCGVCVLIKLIKHSKDKKILQKISNYITKNEPLFFIQHPYANYAVQSLIINPDALPFCAKIIETIVNNYLSLSMQKFSSNVVENCIKYADETSVKKIYNAIIEQEKLESLLNNNYGNYVIEKLIERLNKEDKNKLIKKIEKIGKNKIISNSLKSII